jgi:hypothetical protein
MRDDPLAVVGHLAERIEVAHVPASPVDGTVDGEFMAGAMRAFATDESTNREVVSTDIEDDEIVQRAILQAHDGTGIAHTGRFRVADGRIVAIYSVYEPIADETT